MVDIAKGWMILYMAAPGATSSVLAPRSDGLQPNSDGLHLVASCQMAPSLRSSSMKMGHVLGVFYDGRCITGKHVLAVSNLDAADLQWEVCLRRPYHVDC